MLYECNYPKFLMKKYGPLLFGLFIPIMTANLVINASVAWPESVIVVMVPLIVSIVLIYLFFKRRDKLRYVAIGKSKIIIRRDGKEMEYNWLDVESISLDRFLGLYELKMKNEEEIYFTPYGFTTWLTGDDSDMGVIINKNKRDLQL